MTTSKQGYESHKWWLEREIDKLCIELNSVIDEINLYVEHNEPQESIDFLKQVREDTEEQILSLQEELQHLVTADFDF